MSNHVNIKTRKKIHPEQISEIIETFNKESLHGNLQVEYSIGTEASWGPHVWLLKYVSGDVEWGRRICWLNTSRHFEMRHGGGGDVMWWIDSAICNEVALKFNGAIVDEGDGVKHQGEVGKYNTFEKYLELVGRNEFLSEFHLSLAPPEFRKFYRSPT